MRFDPLFSGEATQQVGWSRRRAARIVERRCGSDILSSVVSLAARTANAPTLIAAMMVFGSGSIAALASMFFAYLRRTVAMEAPERIPTSYRWTMACNTLRSRKRRVLFGGPEYGRHSS